MASTHSASTILASISNAAAATKTSSTVNKSTGYDAIITAKVTNGATGPTVACTVTVNVSPDGTTFYVWVQGTASTVANAITPFGWDLSPAIMYYNVVFSGNTGQAVTVEAQTQITTGI